jgi:hypothetical protein
MFPAMRFRLNVIADLGDNDTPLYVLALDCGSILGALYALVEALVDRMREGTLRPAELASELIEILRPMSLRSGLYPPDAALEGDATLSVAIAQETVGGEGDIDVVELQLQVHPRQQGAAVPAVGSETEREVVGAALQEEWDYLAELDGFVGSDEALFQGLCSYLERPAVLAKRVLFLRTLARAQNVVSGVYVTHDARNALAALTRGLDDLYQREAEHQEHARVRARLAHLQ